MPITEADRELAREIADSLGFNGSKTETYGRRHEQFAAIIARHNEPLREALRNHGRHSPNCPLAPYIVENPDVCEACTCGLWAALRGGAHE